MKRLLVILLLLSAVPVAQAQTIAQIKKVLDTTSNPVGFVKFVLKKKFYIDTIAVVTTGTFLGKADSLAYYGKVGKTYGPFKGENILIKILYKAPNTFYHVNHILLDTSTYTPRYAASLADSIVNKIKTGKASFASMASTYSADYMTAHKGGDLGWFVRGVMLPQLDDAIAAHRKGELFTVWTKAGLHVIRVADNPKKDTGYVLFLRVIL
ncbi:MAG: peptidylprolyl isomerase [Bacteroidetes bacterium]|nr:peptidylprolyl isomerase [Bacteroidota bacterium]